ncbi:DUF4097 family beta strand repeat-containing protein [Microtetraspora malaysiensis]|uniref:DUF4097 family beta strand repeat-containing protein n=1 Tax=Microtetraspora malaysiensis TaxID=161358 RepID=UPI0008366E5B|nr:DUF4097 family beta strand repeat-containing protein [Microtetraspora malaysiensis]
MRRKNIAVLGLALGLGLTIAACDLRFDGNAERDTLTYDVGEKVAAMTVRTGGGDVTVNASDRSDIKVTETLWWRGNKPRDGHRVSGDTLTLEYDCNRCGVDYRIEVPRAMNVKIDTGAGDVTLRELSGPVELHSGTGEVDATGLASRKVSVETGTGEVKLKYVAAPEDVRAEAGTGEITLWLPAETYNVTAEAGLGNREIEVDHDSSSPRKVVVTSGVGDVKVLKL